MRKVYEKGGMQMAKVYVVVSEVTYDYGTAFSYEDTKLLKVFTSAMAAGRFVRDFDYVADGWRDASVEPGSEWTEYWGGYDNKHVMTTARVYVLSNGTKHCHMLWIEERELE